MEISIVKKIINAPIGDVWSSWNDFANIYKFNPGVESSRLLSAGEVATSVGVRRECELSDGKNWLREEIVEYTEQRRLKIEVYESSMPLKSMFVTFDFETTPADGTEVTMTSEFEPGLGIVGKLIAPLMNRQIRKMSMALLDGNADYVTRHRCERKAA